MKKHFIIFSFCLLTALTCGRMDHVQAEEINYTETAPSEAVASTEDYIPVYAAADASSSQIGKLYDDNLAMVLGREGDWCLISSGNLFGYAPAEGLIIDSQLAINDAVVVTAEVCADHVHVRREPSLEAEVLGEVSFGQYYAVADTADAEWTAIEFGGDIAYIASEYITIERKYTYGETLQEEKARLEYEQSGQSVIDFARQFIGNPYVWGGTSLTDGADCSGFVMSVYAHFGISLPHSSRDLRSCGYEVSYEEAQPGDIICYSGHVALYAGNDRIVHAFNSSQGIVESDALYKSIICVRRMY